MATDQVAARFIVSGKVQGVFFRASAAREAARLGIHGHAINLPDGRVEVLACGPAAAVEDLFRWLHRGPPAARVDAVEREPAPVPAAAGFRTG
jgi:acylphosphatase